jgi:hypothetical protein
MFQAAKCWKKKYRLHYRRFEVLRSVQFALAGWKAQALAW